MARREAMAATLAKAGQKVKEVEAMHARLGTLRRIRDTVADLAKLADALRTAGYKEEDIVGIMSGNWQRLLERALPKTV